MTRLLIIYLVIMLVSRILRGFQESKRTAPQRREPGPFPALEEDEDLVPEVEAFPREGRDVVLARPRPFETSGRERPQGEGVTLEWAEIEEARSQDQPREKGRVRPVQVPQKSRDKRSAAGLFSQPGAWAQGIIMSEVLLPPRAQRPWRPQIKNN